MKQINRLAIFLGLLPAVLSAQYTQSFDSATMPADWTVINNGDSNEWMTWDDSASEPHTGSHFLGIEYSSDAHDDYAISPAIIVTPGVSDKLSFWAMNGLDFFLENFSVKISTTTPTAAAFTATLATNITPPEAWTKYTYDLSAYAGQTIYIAFYSSTTDQFFLGIDDFEVYGNSLSTSETDKRQVRIYPNPVVDILNIESKNKISTVSIYDMSGKLQKQEEVNSNNAKINVQNLIKGIYLVRFKEGLEEKTYKMIKK